MLRTIGGVGNERTSQPGTPRGCERIAYAVGFAENATYSDVYAGGGDDRKNALATVVPIPDERLDWLRLTVANAINIRAWSAEPELMDFVDHNRLNGFAHVIRGLDPNGTAWCPA